MPKVILAGGGTGGHIFPAMAIVEELKKRRPEVEIIFMGTKRGLEAKLLPESGYKLLFLDVRGFKRKADWHNLFFFYYLLKSYAQARKILKELKPDVVVGTGGYVSGPPLRAASKLGIPVIIQEQNSYPGITTRLLAKSAGKVFLAYPDSRKFFKRQDNIEIVGNPVRSNFTKMDKLQARRALNIGEQKKVILILGGSQGSVAINQSILDNGSSFQNQDWLQVIWQTGKKDYARINSALQGKNLPVLAIPFIDQMGAAYAACDLVVSRAGALTLAEITLCGKPAILIPYPHAAADHQRHNAEVLAKAGAAEMFLEKDLGSLNLVEKMLKLVQDEVRLEIMSHQSRKLARPEALDRIVSEIIKQLDRARN